MKIHRCINRLVLSMGFSLLSSPPATHPPKSIMEHHLLARTDSEKYWWESTVSFSDKSCSICVCFKLELLSFFQCYMFSTAKLGLAIRNASFRLFYSKINCQNYPRIPQGFQLTDPHLQTSSFTHLFHSSINRT